RAARERARAARSEPARISSYDDPVASWEAWNAPESFRVDQADNNIFKLSQKIPFPGKRGLAGRMAERDADVSSADASATERGLVAMVKRAYYALWQTHKNLTIYSRDKALVEHLAKIAEGKYVVGQVSQPDVLRSQVELTRLINRVTTETTDRVAREVQQAFVRARTALLQRDLLINTHVPLAEQTLGASEIGYQTGKLDFLSLIDSLRAV